MANRRGFYPHPVLDDSDDVDGSFEIVNPVYESFQDSISISFEIRISNDEYLQMYKDGAAALSARWRSSATLAHGDLQPQLDRMTAEGGRFHAYLAHDEVRGEIKVSVKLIAPNPIDQFSLKSHNTIFGGTQFAIKEGDVLADGGTFSIQAEKSYDPLNPPVSAWLVFHELEGTAQHLRLDLSDDDHVVVGFSQATLSNFDAYRSRPDLQVIGVVLPVLVELLWHIRTSATANSEDLEGRAWYRSLLNLIEQNNSQNLEPFEQAQKILEDPIGKAFGVSLIGDEEE